jgi:hypothetical protein
VAVIYRAEINPSKIELIGSWLPTQPWFGARRTEGLLSLGAYRFDDPAGEVGIETLLVDVAGEVVQVPMTYRGAPLAGAQAWLMGVMEHSVLGRRWVYDATADPVNASELAAAVLTGGTQVAEFVEGDGGPTFRESTVSVKGSGSAGSDVAAVTAVQDLEVATADSRTTVTAPAWELTVARIVGDSGVMPAGGAELVGTWAARSQPVVLAAARRR